MNIHRALIYALSFLACSPVFAAEDYEINLTRPVKVGQKYEMDVSVEMSEQITTSSQGRVQTEEKTSYTATFAGTITVLKIDDLKRESELEAFVAKCRKKIKGNDTEEDVLPKGTQVVVRLRNSKMEFLVDGKIASKETAEVLGDFFSLSKSRGTDNDIFGTKDRKQVGDHWPLNSIAAANAAPRGIKVDAKNIKGNTKIEKVVMVHGTKCLQINNSFEMSKFTMPSFPKWMVIEKANISASGSGAFPVDTSIRRLSQKVKMTVTITAKGKPTADAPEMTLSMKMASAAHHKWRFIE